MMNLANFLTLARMAFLPFIIWLLYLSGFTCVMIAFGLYALGALTDFADGWVARKFNQITPFGTAMDPIVDKVYVAALLIMLVATRHIMGVWIILPVIILSREFLVSGLREFLGPYNVKFPVTKLAKWKTTLQMVAIGFLIVSPHIQHTYEFGIALLLAATVLTLITGWGYLKTGLDHIKKMP